MIEAIKDGSRWGDWILHADTLALEYRGEHGRYEIDLETITDSAQMLDWIFQVRIKAWVTNDVMGDLISAFEGIFRPQGSLCGQGIDKKLDATKFLKKRLGQE